MQPLPLGTVSLSALDGMVGRGAIYVLSVIAPVESMQYEAGVRPPPTLFWPSLSWPTVPAAAPVPEAVRPKQQVLLRATKALAVATRAAVAKTVVFIMIEVEGNVNERNGKCFSSLMVDVEGIRSSKSCALLGREMSLPL